MGSTLFGLVGFALTIYAWVWAAKRSKSKGRGFLKRHLAGLGAFIGANVILAIVAGILFPAPANDRSSGEQSVTSSEPTPAPEESSSVPADPVDNGSQAEQNDDVSELYTVESDDYLGDVKRTVEVTLDHRITESQLTQIAKVIRADQRRDTTRTFISYRLAEQEGGGTYWATTHYDPDLKVYISGTTEQQQAELEANDTGPEQFNSVKAVFEAFQDYPPEGQRNFELISTDPLHIRVSPDVLEADLDDVKTEMTQRAAFYGVFTTFVHTSADRVIVDAVPLENQGLRDENPKRLGDRKLTLDMSRDDAARVVHDLMGYDSLSQVKTLTEYGYAWSGGFENYYYENLPAFMSAVAPYCTGACD